MTTVYSKMAPTAISIAGIYFEVIKIKIMVLISFDAAPSLNIKKVPRGKNFSGNFETNNNDLKGEKMTRKIKTPRRKLATARKTATTRKLMTSTTTKPMTTTTKKSLTSSTTMLSEKLKAASKDNQALSVDSKNKTTTMSPSSSTPKYNGQLGHTKDVRLIHQHGRYHDDVHVRSSKSHLDCKEEEICSFFPGFLEPEKALVFKDDVSGDAVSKFKNYAQANTRFREHCFPITQCTLTSGDISVLINPGPGQPGDLITVNKIINCEASKSSDAFRQHTSRVHRREGAVTSRTLKQVLDAKIVHRYGKPVSYQATWTEPGITRYNTSLYSHEYMLELDRIKSSYSDDILPNGTVTQFAGDKLKHDIRWHKVPVSKHVNVSRFTKSIMSVEPVLNNKPITIRPSSTTDKSIFNKTTAHPSESVTSTDSSFCFSLQNESVVSRVVKEGALGAGMQLGHEATKLGLRYLIDKKMREKYDLSHADVWNYRPHVLESRDKVKKAFPGRANALDKAGNVRKLHFAQIIAPNLILTFYPLIIDAVEHTIGEPGHSYESLATIANVMGGFSAFITSAYRDHLELTQHQWHARVFDMGRLLLQAVIPNILDLCQQGFVDECGTGLSSAVSNIMVLATTMYFVRMIAGCFQCLFCSDNFTEYDDVESSVPSQDEAVDQLLNSSNENQSGRGQDSGPIIEEVFGDDEGSNSPSQDEADHELLSNMGSARSRLSSNAMSHFGSRNRSQANGAVDSEANNSSASQLNLPG